MNIDQCKKRLSQLWENISTLIGMIHTGRYNKADIEIFDARLKAMIERYSYANLNSGSVSIPDWMLNKSVFDLSIVKP